MLIASRNRSAIDKLKKGLSFEFEMKDLDEVKKVLGVEIERDQKSGKICSTQNGYSKKVLQKFNINNDTKSVSIPLTPHFKLKATILLLLLKSVSICLTYPMLVRLEFNVCNSVYEVRFVTSYLNGQHIQVGVIGRQ